MGQVVWFSTLLIMVLICQRLETANLICYRDMAYSETRAFYIRGDRGQLVIRDKTLNRAILCDTQTDGGGWIVIQRRKNGDVDFYRNWTDYKRGFGTPLGDFWLGNNAMYELTNKDAYELRIDLNNGTHDLFALYSTFKIESEWNNYRLRLGSHSGTLGEDSTEWGLTYYNGMMFSTYDRDNDEYSGHCAQIYMGGWWYRGCHYPNLNGRWGVEAAPDTMMWWAGSTHYYYIQSIEMKMRRI